MRLPQGEPIEPSQLAKLVEAGCLPRLGKDDKQPVNFFTGTRPPRASTRGIVRNSYSGVIRRELHHGLLFSPAPSRYLAQIFGECRPNRQSAETLYPSLALFEIERARAQIPVQELAAPDVEIQAFLSQRSGREHMRPKWRIERPPHIVCAQSDPRPGQNILDLRIREWHRSVATKQKAVITRARLVQTMAALMQSEGFEKITRKTRNGIGVELAGYP